jgi:hypothetical protein
VMAGDTGRVHGTNDPGDRESAWDKTDHNGLIALHWEAIRRARAETTIDRDSGTAFELALEHRPMLGPERDFAMKVFGPTLPVERIRLTNLLGIGRRPFTIPTVGETILVNLGAGLGDPIGYDGLGDPDNPQRQARGQLFIHELAHAWQIGTASFLPGLMCDAVAASATTVGGDMGVYQYGAPDQAFSDFNPEQQASIVDDWFAGSGLRQGAFDPAVESDLNPYFRYIRDNIRRRIP